MENTNQVSDSVIRKIQLLFELANQKVGNDGASNEIEASAAMAKAQELLAKYNLDLQMVQNSNTSSKEEGREKVNSSRTAMYEWQQNLCKAICEANFCFYWITITHDEWQISGGAKKKHSKPRRVKRHTILGKLGNVTVAQMMYEYLADTIEKIIPYKGAERLSSSANSWREGCAERLIERIQAKAEAMKKSGIEAREEGGSTTTSCSAIVVRDIFEKEYAGNYDARYGVGAYARKLSRDADWEARYAKEQEERVAARAKMLAEETPGDRAKREKEEAKQAERDRKADERYWRREDRKASRRDWNAYERGRSKAEDIGLDSQLSNRGENKRIG